MKSAKADAKKTKEAEWLQLLWIDRGLGGAVTVLNAGSAWLITRQAAQKRLEKLKNAGYLDSSARKGNEPHQWVLTPRGSLAFGEVQPS